VTGNVREILEETLQTPVYVGKVIYTKGVTKVKRRLVMWNDAFTRFLREQTKDNSRVASFVRGSVEQRRSFIRCFLDSRRSVGHTTYHVERHDYDINFPRIVIKRCLDDSLLKSFAGLLRQESIEPAVTRHLLSICKQRDIGHVLRKELISHPVKLQTLRDLYEQLREYQRIA